MKASHVDAWALLGLFFLVLIAIISVDAYFREQAKMEHEYKMKILDKGCPVN